MKQAVHPADVHKSAVVGDVADDSFAGLSDLEFLLQLGALFRSLFFQDLAAADQHVLVATVQLDHFAFHGLTEKDRNVLHGRAARLRGGHKGTDAI